MLGKILMSIHINNMRSNKRMEHMLVHLEDSSASDPQLDGIFSILLFLLDKHFIISEQ
jgi:hypothetical protein